MLTKLTNGNASLTRLNDIILNTDSYKLSHFLQYPENTEEIFSYVEARKPNKNMKETLFFGLQDMILRYLTMPISIEDIAVAKKIIETHGFPFNDEGWNYILEEHNGYLPLRIKAVPEGTVVPIQNVLATVEATDPKCYWLVTYLETAILRACFYGTSVASNSLYCKRIIKRYMEETCDNLDGLPFKLHDFGARGVSSQESAGIGGAAHLVNFMGTDTIAGLIIAMESYKADMAGFSIPASEHSTMTAYGPEREKEAFQNMIDKFAGEGKLFACVSDSYDIYNAVKNIWGERLLTKVKEAGATVVIRPDSGDPLTMPIEVIELLMDKVGYTVNSKGYKVLPAYVRVIQGDGITPESLEKILENMKFKKLSVDNIAFGMGAGLLQKVDRDTYGFAMKCSHIIEDGKSRDVYKSPISDKKKVSKKGKLTLIQEQCKFITTKLENVNVNSKEVLQVAYEFKAGMNTPFVRRQSFDEIRKISEKYV